MGKPLSIFLAGLLTLTACSSVPSGAPGRDPHYNELGFFDIHVCNWPSRPLFFMALFSTIHFKEVREIEVRDPEGRLIGNLDLAKYSLVKVEGKPEKRVFISHFDISVRAPNGWYEARVTLNDGRTLFAKDYVRIEAMPLPQGFRPEEGSELAEIPTVLSWDPVPGARFYKVFIKDLWTGQTIHQSKLLSESRLMLPPHLLQRGEYYSWRVHARDINEDPVLGDFNLGTLSQDVIFSIAK